MQKRKVAILICLAILLTSISHVRAQEPRRLGTTAANFLEYGYSAAGNAMGDAYTSLSDGLSSVYWNPAGLAAMEHNEIYFLHQPWFAGINTSHISFGVPVPGIGNIGLGLITANYGDIPVTTLKMPEGTGEKFSAQDIAINLTYARKIANWFAFGTSVKYISSQIWHTSAHAIALDVGVSINTIFFSPDGSRKNGLKIGMSISNYGSRMQFDGIDLISPIDINPYEEGNFRDVPGQFRLSKWELPLIFRLGASLTAIATANHQLIIAMDALHPNNNSEYVNLGMQYALTSPGLGRFFLRGGYKGLFMYKSQFGLTFGFGTEIFIMNNRNIKIEYGFREHQLLGNLNCFSVGLSF